jgi:hypothetical protein
MAAALAPTALCRDWTANVAADMSHFSPRTKSTFGELPMADHHFVTDYNKIVKDLIEIKRLVAVWSGLRGGELLLSGSARPIWDVSWFGRKGPFLRPGLTTPRRPRAAAVKDGRRPPRLRGAQRP